MIEIDVEKAFTDFVRSFGAEILEDTYGTTLPFKNADFIFHGENVVGELKRLVDNKDKDEDIQEKIQAKFDAWMSEGTIGKNNGRTVINSHSLPLECQRELIDIFKPALQRRVLKANKQIRQTLSYFNLVQSKGVLFIVNDGNYALEADAAIYLIGRILGNACSSVNSVIYFTVNMLATSPLTQKQTLVWAHVNRRKIIDPVDSKFVEKLFDGWRNYLEQLHGEPIEKILADNADMAAIKYEKKDSQQR